MAKNVWAWSILGTFPGNILTCRTQQVDFRIAFGLNHNAPSYSVGIGYYWRFDGLYGQLPM